MHCHRNEPWGVKVIPSWRILSCACFSSTTRSTSVRLGRKTSRSWTRFPLFVTQTPLPWNACWEEKLIWFFSRRRRRRKLIFIVFQFTRSRNKSVTTKTIKQRAHQSKRCGIFLYTLNDVMCAGKYFLAVFRLKDLFKNISPEKTLTSLFS